MSAYAEALRRAVTPGCTVFDIGAGPGIFSVLACKYGAARVVAIDPNDSVELVCEIAEANGCADKISVFRGLSTDYSPPAKADVIVSDIRGTLPLFEGHIAAIADARQRLLAPGGTLIPMRDNLRVALANAAKEYRPYEKPWLRNKFGVDLSAGHRFVVNAFAKVNLKPANLLSRSETLAVLDYRSMRNPELVTDFDLKIEEGGTAHGLVLWFDAQLLDGIGFSNAPGEPRQIYGQTLFPFERPIEVAPGDHVVGQLAARLVDRAYVWTWQTEAGGTRFQQSSFLASVIAPDRLRAKANTFAPPARAVHEVDRYCLSRFDGSRSLQLIAEETQAKFPDAFADAPAALNHVTRLAGRYQDMGS